MREIKTGTKILVCVYDDEYQIKILAIDEDIDPIVPDECGLCEREYEDDKGNELDDPIDVCYKTKKPCKDSLRWFELKEIVKEVNP